jgi:pilus assembly protein CpaF
MKMNIANEDLFSKVNFGSLMPLLDDVDVTDVSCKNKNEVWVTSNSKGHYLTTVKMDEKEILRIVNQIANKMHKQFNPAHPSLEGDIQGADVDYRVGCVHNYLSVNGTCFNLRKVRKTQYLNYDQLIKDKYVSKSALNSLILAVKGKANIVIIGNTGSGKSELLKFLSQYIPVNDVIVTIEDSLEFNVKTINPAASCISFRVKDKYSYSDIIAMSLRLNVKRIMLQEARGGEVKDLLDAMSTGHNVMTTMHARGANVLVSRIKQMLKDDNESFESLKKRVYSLIDLVVYIDAIETSEGIFRRIGSITEYLYDPKNNCCSDKNIYKANGRCYKYSDSLMDLINNNLRGTL